MSRSAAIVSCVSIAAALAAGTPALAQGKGNGKGHNSQPPSSSPLPSPTVVTPATVGTVPFAWIDDASMLPPGSVAMSVSAQHWQGADLGEFTVPSVGMATGLTPRVQVGASFPRVVGDDVNGVVGGLGTSYVSGKIGLLTGGPSDVKLAVAPTIEILGAGAVQALAPDGSRLQFGVPLSLEVDRGRARVFASTGFFTGGVWFAGGGVGAQVTPRVTVSGALSRAWTTDSVNGIVGDRREVSGSLAYSPRPGLFIFGSLGQTIATTDQNGAGTTLTGGVLFLLSSTAFR